MKIEDLEQARKTCAKKMSIILIVSAVFYVIFLLVSLANLFSLRLRFYPPIAFFAFIVSSLIFLIFSVVIALIATMKDRKKYRKLYKAYFVERSLKQYFTDIKYNHESALPKTILESTGMVYTGDRYSSNDYTIGKYKDVTFSQADVKIEEEHSTEDDKSYVTIFKGRWMIFEFPKPFNFRLEVVQKHFRVAKKATRRTKTDPKMRQISTESITFDKKFRVYAEDGLEAYYLLDPAFIDHIENLSEVYSGEMFLCFSDNKLHVAINNGKDAFEPPSIFKILDEKAEMEKVNRDIKTITDYVDYLKLDHKLFKSS